MIVLAIMQNFMKFLTPSKSIPQKSNHDVKENNPYVRAVAFVPLCNDDILTKNSCFFGAAF